MAWLGAATLLPAPAAKPICRRSVVQRIALSRQVLFGFERPTCVRKPG